MLLELIYKDQLLITGTVKDVIRRLTEHSLKYTTLKELLDGKRPQ